VLGHDGGSNNLAALQGLLVRKADQAQTPLKVLIDTGFTPDQIISVLRHNGGSKNLAALQGLLVRKADQAQTPLKVLIDTGFTHDQIISVLGHDGGSKTLDAVLNLYRSFPACGWNDKEKELLLSLAQESCASGRIIELRRRLLADSGLDKKALLNFLKNKSNKKLSEFSDLSPSVFAAMIASTTTSPKPPTKKRGPRKREEEKERKRSKTTQGSSVNYVSTTSFFTTTNKQAQESVSEYPYV